MATTIATISLTSTDLLSSALAFTSSNSLTTAGSATGLTLTSGLARTTTSYASSGVIESTNLYRSDDATTNGANKVYLKNLSTTAAEYYTIFVDEEELGRLYAGDWAFFPWNATSGTKEAFTVTIANTWAAGDTFVFDGVTVVAADSTLNNIAAQIDAAQYPNWVTSVSSAVVTFVARYSNAGIEIDTSEAVSTTAGDGTGAVATTVTGTRSVSDIYIKPSVETGITYECMLIHE